MKRVIFFLFGLLILLQVRLWVGDGSFSQVRTLKKEIVLQQNTAEKLKERNQTLEAEVQDLKHRLGALEERARTDLGMVRQSEVFYQFSMKDEK